MALKQRSIGRKSVVTIASFQGKKKKPLIRSNDFRIQSMHQITYHGLWLKVCY